MSEAFDFEQYEKMLEETPGPTLSYSELENTAIYTNANVFAGEAFAEVPEGTRCGNEDCYIDHGGERLKYHMIVVDLFQNIEDEDETPNRIIIPVESLLGQALVTGQFAEVAIQRITDFAESMGETVQWNHSDDDDDEETSE